MPRKHSTTDAPPPEEPQIAHELSPDEPIYEPPEPDKDQIIEELREKLALAKAYQDLVESMIPRFRFVIQSGDPYIVISAKEEYFRASYIFMRDREMTRQHWSPADEAQFNFAMDVWRKRGR